MGSLKVSHNLFQPMFGHCEPLLKMAKKLMKVAMLL